VTHHVPVHLGRNQTAYFVIPENVKHGEELICSYFACRNAGIKFRYCSHCKVPVAKRNFRKRHKHGGEDMAQIPGDDSEAEDEIPHPKKGIPTQITANRKDDDGLKSESTDSDRKEKKPSAQKGAAARAPAFESSKKKKKEVPARASAAVPVLQFKEGTKISFDRQKRWMELLEKRPSTRDGDSMSAWLMEVLAVSDLDTPLKPAAQDGALVSDSDKARARSATQAAQDRLKAAAGREDPDSPRSETGYGSDASNNNNNDGDGKAKKKKTPSNEEKKAESVPVAAAGAGIVKKKRPAEEEADGGGTGGDEKDPDPAGGKASSQPAEFFVSGSFAAWKERKKQKKQAKLSGQGTEGNGESDGKGEAV